MSGVLKSSFKHPESSVSQSGSSMHFWGICCESGKQYAQVVGQRFRVTMAVLDPKSFQNDSTDKIVSLLVIRGGIEYLLCVLKHAEIHQVPLNLIFDKGENVKFYINGHGKVYLSGYQLTDSEKDVLDDENGYLCPLVEVKSKGKKSSKDKISKSPVDAESEAISPKSKKKSNKVENLWTSFISEMKSCDDDDDDDSDDNSDEDFSAGDEGSESDDDDDVSDEEEELDSEELRKEEEPSNSDDSDEENEDEQLTENFSDSRKRRRHEKSAPQKRSKVDSFNNSSFNENAEDIDDEIESDNNMNSSIGHTPMPKKKKKSENVSSEKKSKKKKRLHEISILSEKSMNKSQQTTNSPSNTSKNGKMPCVKLEGGVEMQDVVVGNGPVAIKGKMVHVFYVGRRPDKSIFDSRTPGKKPFSFKLGANQVIKGWEVGLQGMKVGGKRKLRVPPNMGYGKSAPEGIPPNSTLFFIVELHSVT